jgi:hypothetical protein
MSDTRFFDGSHQSPTDFTVRVIDYAISRGFEIDEAQYRADLDWLKSDEDDEDRLIDIREALDWTYDDALDYLNEIDNPAGRAWYVEDNSLFMEELDD